MDHFVVWHAAHTRFRIVRAEAGRNLDLGGLGASFDCVEDDVLLKNLIISECVRPGLVDMDGAERHLREEVVAECFEIRAVAEAPWRNPGQLTVGPQQPRSFCNGPYFKAFRYGASATARCRS